MSFGSPAIVTFACCSKGRRMFTPKDASRPAPPWAAPMIPSPAPVITIQPDRTIRSENSRAWIQSGCSGRVRALPNTATFRIAA